MTGLSEAWGCELVVSLSYLVRLIDVEFACLLVWWPGPKKRRYYTDTSWSVVKTEPVEGETRR